MARSIAARQATSEDGEWIPTTCGMCVYGGCATRVHVMDGIVTKVEGNPEALHNLGRLCPRGNAVIMDLYDPYRVKVPMKRTNPEKGLDVDPKFVEITWEEAIDIVVEKLRAVRDEDPRGFFINGGLSSGSPGVLGFQKLFGSTHNIHYFGGQGACGNSEHSVSAWTHFAGLSGWDPEYTDLFIQVGGGAGFGSWLGGAGCGVQRMADSRVERGMRVVIIDPRCSEGGNKANEWIPIVPGTDLALFLAMMHVMLHELNRYDVDFLKRYTNGPYLIRPDGYYMRDTESPEKPLVWDTVAQEARRWDEVEPNDVALEGVYEVNGEPCRPALQMVKDRMLPYTPEWQEPITTVPAATTRRLAADFVNSAKIGATITLEGIEFPYRPVSIIGYHGLNRHMNSPFNVMAFNLLNALVGSYDVPGGNTGWPVNELGLQFDPYNLPPPADGVLELVPWAEVGGSPTDMDLHQLYPMTWDAAANPKWTLTDPELREKFKIPYTFKAMLQSAGNPFRSMGDPRQTEKAYQAIEFIVSHALWIDDPTLFADVLLPCPSKLEGLVIQNYTRLWRISVEGTMLRQPVIEPLYNTRSMTEIQIELAERLGFLYGEGGLLDSINMMLQMAPHSARLDINRKPTEEEIADTQLRARFGDEKGLDWWKERGLQMSKSTAKELYRWLPLYGRRYPIYLEPLLGLGETLKSRVKENLGIDWDISWYDPLPRWEPCPEHDAAKFPPDFDLYTINFKTAVNTHQTSASNVWLSEIFEADPYYLRVWMNEETGKKKGLRDGDKVWVESTITKVEGRVKLSQAIHPQVVGIAHGQGSWATSPFARKGINYASLIPLNREEHVNPLVSSQEWCTRVKVTKRS